MSFDVAKFKIYPWWKKGKRSDDYFEVCYTEKRSDIWQYANGLKLAPKPRKWFAQASFREDKKDKHHKGYVFFCKKSIKDPTMVAHELVHVTQFYFGYLVFPLCNTLQRGNHELIAHSHTFMMKRIIDFAKTI